MFQFYTHFYGHRPTVGGAHPECSPFRLLSVLFPWGCLFLLLLEWTWWFSSLLHVLAACAAVSVWCDAARIMTGEESYSFLVITLRVGFVKIASCVFKVHLSFAGKSGAYCLGISVLRSRDRVRVVVEICCFNIVTDSWLQAAWRKHLRSYRNGFSLMSFRNCVWDLHLLNELKMIVCL